MEAFRQGGTIHGSGSTTGGGRKRSPRGVASRSDGVKTTPGDGNSISLLSSLGVGVPVDRIDDVDSIAESHVSPVPVVAVDVFFIFFRFLFAFTTVGAARQRYNLLVLKQRHVSSVS